MLYELLKHMQLALPSGRDPRRQLILNKIELTIAKKNIRTIVMTLVEANLKLIRDAGSINNTGLTMLRNVAVSNQLAGRRHFGARDVATCLLKELPVPEALTLSKPCSTRWTTGRRSSRRSSGRRRTRRGSTSSSTSPSRRASSRSTSSTRPPRASGTAGAGRVRRQVLSGPFMNNTCRIASTRFGSLPG